MHDLNHLLMESGALAETNDLESALQRLLHATDSVREMGMYHFAVGSLYFRTKNFF